MVKNRFIILFLVLCLASWSYAGVGNLGGIDNYTKLLCHFNSGTVAETGQTLTFVGTAQLDGTQKKFGTASLLLDGNSDSVTIPDSADWDFGTDPMTFDCWVWFNALPGASQWSMILAHDHNSAPFAEFYFALSNTSGTYYWEFENYGAGATQTFFKKATTVSINTWYHVALVRTGSNWYIFQNGTQVGATHSSANAFPYSAIDASLEIGRWRTWYFNGRIDEPRISKGVARWTSNFTPPSREYNNYRDIGLRISNSGTTYIVPIQDLTTQKLRIRKNSTTYGVPLLETSDSYATGLKTHDGDSIKSIPLEAN